MKTMQDLWDAYRTSNDKEDLRRFAGALLITGPLYGVHGVWSARMEGNELIITRRAYPTEDTWNPWCSSWDFCMLPHPQPNLDTTPIPDGI